MNWKEFTMKYGGGLTKYQKRGEFKPDFRSKSQAANEQGNTGESSTVAPKMNPIAIRLIDEANAEKLKNQQPAFKQGYSKTASDIERSDYYRKQKELRDALKNLDVVTDIMQVGNFIPHPIAQGIGQVGNWLGAATDVTQAGMDYGNENYGGMGINLASAIVPTALGSASFRRNSKYLRPGQVLYPFSPQGLNPKLGINAARTDYLEPFNMVKRMTKNNLMANRALLGTLGVETAYDAGAFNNNTRLGLPINMQQSKTTYKSGGGLPKYQRRGEVSYSSLVDPKTKKINLEAFDRLQSLLKEQELIAQSRPEGAKALPEIQITAERPGLGSRIRNAIRPYVAPEGGFLDQWRQRIVDATGGADWYKQPNSVLNAFSSIVTAPLAAPQYGAVYGATGKVQTPSEAMNIQNPYGAFAVDAILDPVNLVTGSSALKLPQRFSKVGRQAGRYASETIPNFSSMLFEDVPFENVPSRISGFGPKAIDPPYTYYRSTSPESFANISNPVNTSGVGTAMPENLTFFTPDAGTAKGTFSEYSPNRMLVGANLLFKNPYKVRQGKVWTNEEIKKLIDEGYDSIQVNYDASGDPTKAYEIIPLDKNIIQNAKPINVSEQPFRSEIDWSKWNRNTPKYPKLISEYNQIEEATKKAGTWMKNPDGTPFEGTPEQFIQFQSSHFKKAFPQGFENVYRGVNKKNAFADFSKGRKISGDRGIFTSNPELAWDYANFHAGTPVNLNPFVNDNVQGLYNLIYPKGKTLVHDANQATWKDVNIFDNITSNDDIEIQKLKDYFRNANLEKITTNDIARYIPESDLNSIVLKNINDGGLGDITVVNNRPGNYLKSLVGNVGFFDMTNPNIYKGLLPYALPIGAAAGAGALQQNQKPKGTYQYGGPTIDLKLPQFEEDKPRPFFEMSGAGTGPQYDMFGYGYVPLGKNLGISADLMGFKEGDWRGGRYGISGNINIPINRGKRRTRPDIKNPVMYQGGGEESTEETPKVISPLTISASESQWMKDKKKFGTDEIKWYESWNPKKWGLNDYSQYSSYNSAFRNARENKEDEFVYKGKRYNTKLIPKEDSDLYWESKNFLKDYYKNQPYAKIDDYDYESMSNTDSYFKNKYGATWLELFEQRKKIPINNPKWQEIDEKMSNIMNEDITIRDHKNPEYDQFYFNLKEKPSISKKIENLDKPSYFSITNQKPKSMSEDGYWDPKNNKTFMVANTEPGKLNTTYVHELSHKGDDVMEVYQTVPPINLKDFNSSPYRNDFSQEQFNYVSDPSEIEARKLSTLFYLKKNKQPWEAGKITEKVLDKLYDDHYGDKLPYDISQLLMLYGSQRDDLLKYLNGDYNYNYKPEQKKEGGETNLFNWNNLDQWFKNGGESDFVNNIYSDYMDGVYDGTPLEENAKKVYDKLNTIYYRQAKESGMTPPNYIMTNVIKKALNPS